MHLNRPPGLPPLAIVLPRPSLPTARSFASAAPSPRTPRTPSCGSSILFANSNRNSTDSWNSSNADDMDCEWKPEQVRLLSRTLDALPAHLVTPFNGPIPPSNLLDKIARGVIDAKGPVEWPHGIRATRAKLIELSRLRAKEERAQQVITEVYSDMEMDGPDGGGNYACFPEPHGKTFGIRRPLYRQSSMDFMNAADLKENDSISCLSDRLQRTDRLIANPAYHPYSRHTPRTFQRRLSSPARPGNVPSLINPSTPSSSTLNTLSSFSTHHNRILNRTPSSTSASSISMVSSNGPGALPDPRVQRVRRADSFCGPAPPPKDVKVVPTLKESPAAGIKRAPSFGALAQEVKRDRHHVFGGALKGPAGEGEKDLPAYPSSDEEEKIRSKGAKKMRVKELGGHDLPVASPPSTSTPTTTSKRTKAKSAAPRADGKPKLASPKSPTPKPKSKAVAKDMLADAENKNLLASPLAKASNRARPAAMNLQRNPSMFGAELPHAKGYLSPGPDSPRSRVRATSPPACLASSPSPKPTKAKLSINTNPVSPPESPQKVKTLRRVRRLAPARRISFGSLVAPGEDADGEEDDELQRDRRRQRELGQLGSAFQLH